MRRQINKYTYDNNIVKKEKGASRKNAVLDRHQDSLELELK